MSKAAKDKAKNRARMREKGYVLKQIWVKPNRWVEIKEAVTVIMERL